MIAIAGGERGLCGSSSEALSITLHGVAHEAHEAALHGKW
jgi:hypothetical protein